jgi:hypothetical protein
VAAHSGSSAAFASNTNPIEWRIITPFYGRQGDTPCELDSMIRDR